MYISNVYFDNNIDKESYLNSLPIIKFLSENSLEFSSDVAFFVGENGSGKSTLLEAIAVNYGFNAEGGSRNFNFSTNATHSQLHSHITLSKGVRAKDGFFLRAESLYNVATNIDNMDSLPSFDGPVIDGYGGVSLHNQSHGESFLSIVQNRFFGNGLYIMDEPEAALSPMKLLTLMTEMDALVKNNSQFIIATHSPILMAFPGAEIFEFTADGIKKTDYRETEHFKVTRQFLNDPDRMLHYLLK